VILLQIAQLAVAIATYDDRVVVIGLPCKVMAFQTVRIILTAMTTRFLCPEPLKCRQSPALALALNFIHVSLLGLDDDPIHLFKRGFARRCQAVERVWIGFDGMALGGFVCDRLTDKRLQQIAVVGGEELANCIHVGADFRRILTRHDDLDCAAAAEQRHASGQCRINDPATPFLLDSPLALSDVLKPLWRNTSGLSSGGEAFLLAERPKRLL